MKNNFTQCTLKDIASNEKGSIISGPFGSNISSKFFQESGVPVIRGNNLSNSCIKFIDNGFAYLTEEKADELNAYAIKDDLLFTAAGTIGQVGIIEENTKFEKYVISNKQLRVRLNIEKINPLYAYYWFSSPWMVKDIVNKNTGSTVPLINLGIIKTLEIKIPKERVIQDKIVSVLSALDSKIELNNRINTELEAMAKMLYDYWFVQFDFPFDFAQGKPDKDGKPYKTSGGKMVWNEELKRDIPNGWKVDNLGKVVQIIRGASPRPIDDYLSKSGIPWLKISDATATNNRFITTTKQFIIEEGVSKSRPVKPNTLILSNSATPAIPRIMKINACVHDGWLIINDYTAGLTQEFMFHYFEYERPRIICLGNGSIFQNLKTDYIKNLKIILPPESVLNKLTPQFKTISEKIYLKTIENQTLAELRDWLLPMLMNGQVQVIPGN